MGLGPYTGLQLDEVAVMDPAYLLALIREAVGPAELRAAAARELALRGALFPEETRPLRGPARSPVLAFGRTYNLAPWILGALAGLLLLGLGRGWGGITRGSGNDRANSGSLSALVPAAGVDLPSLARAVEPSSGARPAGSFSASSKDADSQATEPASDDAAGFDPSAPCGARVEGAVPAEAAADFLDTFQAVEMPVVGTKDTGKVTFLNSHDPYQGHFYVAIFPGDYALYPEHPARYFKGRCILVQGSIEAYRGTPQIVLRDPADVRVVGEISAPVDLGEERAGQDSADHRGESRANP
jgi:hypothetical protein